MISLDDGNLSDKENIKKAAYNWTTGENNSIVAVYEEDEEMTEWKRQNKKETLVAARGMLGQMEKTEENKEEVKQHITEIIRQNREKEEIREKIEEKNKEKKREKITGEIRELIKEKRDELYKENKNHYTRDGVLKMEPGEKFTVGELKSITNGKTVEENKKNLKELIDRKMSKYKESLIKEMIEKAKGREKLKEMTNEEIRDEIIKNTLFTDSAWYKYDTRIMCEDTKGGWNRFQSIEYDTFIRDMEKWKPELVLPTNWYVVGEKEHLNRTVEIRDINDWEMQVGGDKLKIKSCIALKTDKEGTESESKGQKMQIILEVEIENENIRNKTYINEKETEINEGTTIEKTFKMLKKRIDRIKRGEEELTDEAKEKIKKHIEITNEQIKENKKITGEIREGIVKAYEWMDKQYLLESEPTPETIKESKCVWSAELETERKEKYNAAAFEIEDVGIVYGIKFDGDDTVYTPSDEDAAYEAAGAKTEKEHIKNITETEYWACDKKETIWRTKVEGLKDELIRIKSDKEGEERRRDDLLKKELGESKQIRENKKTKKTNRTHGKGI